MDCIVNDLYESLEFCKGSTVLPGIIGVYYMSKSQILTYPTLPDLSTKDVSMSDLATLVGDYVTAADSYWHKLDILTTASKLNPASQGENLSKTFVNNLTLFFPGTDEKATGFCRLANTDDLIFIVHTRDNKFRVVGNKMIETDVKPSQDSGQNITDSTGTTIEVTSTDLCPAPYYKGKLTLKEGILDCSTGEIESAD